LLVFDVEAADVSLILHGVSWCNLHPQYCRSLDPTMSHDILIQENHGNVCGADGQVTRLVQGRGADIHVIRDDGMNFRDLPWGRDGNEFCQGHQCWRGRSGWAITSTGKNDVKENQLIEGLPCQGVDHDGLTTPGGMRNDLTREWPAPKFYHFATDLAGERFITDVGPSGPEGGVAFGILGEPGKDPLRLRRLLTARGTWLKSTHLHPFLSPDGRTGFFNSDESGLLQAYMIRGLDSVKIPTGYSDSPT
jgi:hypothetical protein